MRRIENEAHALARQLINGTFKDYLIVTTNPEPEEPNLQQVIDLLDKL